MIKVIATFLIIVSCSCISSITGCSLFRSRYSTSTNASHRQTTAPSVASIFSGDQPEKQSRVIATTGQTDGLHAPPKGSSERQAVMDVLREEYKKRKDIDGKPYRGRITFVVNYLKVHAGWAWVYADPQSSDPQDRFGENNGFLLHQQDGQWRVMSLPPVVNDPDDPENLDYPARKDIEKIRRKYPSIPTDIFPHQK